MAASCAGSAQDAFKTLIVSSRMFTASIQKNLKTQFACLAHLCRFTCG
jgi:hypothetical protein